MADSLRILAQMVLTPDDSAVPKLNTGQFTATIAAGATRHIVATEQVTSTASQLNIFDAGLMPPASVGYILVANEASSAQTVYLGFNDVSTDRDAMPIQIEPGEFAMFDVYNGHGAGLYAKTTTGTADIVVYAFNSN